MDKVYIILVNFNGEKYTLDCIESLKKVSYENFQIIIVDNSPTIDSLNTIENEFIKRNYEYTKYEELDLENIKTEHTDSAIIVIKQRCNKGFASANNLGIKYARIQDDYTDIILLNNDTVVENVFIDKLIEAKKQYGDGLYTGKMFYYDEPDKVWYAGGKFNKLTGKCRHLNIQSTENAKVSFITFCLVLITKKVIEDVGYLDETYFMYCEDLDYCYKVTSHGYPLYYIPKSVVYHKVGASSDTKDKVSLFSATWGYRNEIKFNKSRKDWLKYISIIIIICARPFIAIKWFIKKRFDIAKIALSTIKDGLR